MEITAYCIVLRPSQCATPRMLTHRVMRERQERDGGREGGRHAAFSRVTTNHAFTVAIQPASSVTGDGGMSREEGRRQEETWVGGGRKEKEIAHKKKKGGGVAVRREGGEGGLILDSIPKEISGLGQTAHTLSKITV